MAVSFDGKVVIVTGAGGGLGRIYALEFAKRGAKVLVNDLGASHTGEGQSKNADIVVEEIKKAGGIAAANYDSVEFGEKIVKAAIDAFGQVDILINNAGILRDVSFGKMTDKDWDMINLVHTRGPYSLARACWPHFQKQKFGRIVNVSSAAGLYGNFGQVNYSTAKSGMIGFTKSLAAEGGRKNIFTNCIVPLAASRMTETVMPKDILESLKPEYISPLVLAMCNPATEINGEIVECGAGWFAKVRIEQAKGVVLPQPMSPEDVLAAWDNVCDFSEPNYPNVPSDSASTMVQAMEAAKVAPAAAKTTPAAAKTTPTAAPAAPAAKSNLKVQKFFDFAELYFAKSGAGKELVAKVKNVYHFAIVAKKGDTNKTMFTIDLAESGTVSQGAVGKASATFEMIDADAVSVMLGELNPQMAFLTGKMKIKGNMGAASKFTPDLFPSIARADFEALDVKQLVQKVMGGSKL